MIGAINMEIVIRPMEQVLSVRPGANLLDVLRENRIPVSYSCTAGRCGTCRCKVLQGKVLDSGHAAIRPQAGQATYVLACQTILTEPCTIEIPEPDEIVVHPARILKATVVSLDEVNHDVTRLRLKPAKPIEFSPGQYAQLHFTPDHVRPYSMAGLCSDELLEFHVRRVPEGRVSGYIAANLKIGEAVKVSGPMGSAYLRRKHKGPMLCVAGGTGLAPILSIVRGAIAASMPNPIHLYFGVRAERDVYGLDVLQELGREHPALHIHVVSTNGSSRAGQRSGLVTEAIAADLRDLAGWNAYLCGSPPMVEAATRLTLDKGVPAERVYADAFYNSAT